MAVTKKTSTVPVNMMDTLNSLNNAATKAPVPQTQPQVQQPVRETVQIQQETPVQARLTPQPVQTMTQQQFSSVNSQKPLKSDGIPTVEMVEHAAEKQEPKPVSSSTEKTMISLRLLKNDKEKFQEFFKSCGLSFTDGLYMAADFVEREVENGRLQMSKSGIQYK